nr:signal peptidase I [Butyrivibrio sp.]
MLTSFVTFIGIAVIALLLLGYRPYILKTQSMEPEYRQGSLCWVDTRVDLEKLSVGDPIVYRSPANSLVLHRLVDISSSGDSSLSVTMQGDANKSTQDVELSHINYIGREAFTLPKLGSIVDALFSHHILWFIVAAFVILACIPWESIRRRREAAA